jgi:hypothetical protein
MKQWNHYRRAPSSALPHCPRPTKRLLIIGFLIHRWNARVGQVGHDDRCGAVRVVLARPYALVLCLPDEIRDRWMLAATSGATA